MKREGSNVRTYQNGSVLGFVVIGSVLVFLLLGGVYAVRQQVLSAESDVTAGPALPKEEEKPTEQQQKPVEAQKQEEKPKEEKPIASHARELPRTGLDAASGVVVFLLVGFFVAFMQSRRRVASL